MTLNELVKLRTNVLKLSDQLYFESLIKDKITTVRQFEIQHGLDEFANEINGLVDCYLRLHSMDQEVSVQVNGLLDKINSQIQLTSQDLTNNFGKYFTYDNNRVLDIDTNFIPLNEKTKKILVAKITKHALWVYPGLILGIRSAEWIKYMASSDPLYLTNYNLFNTRKHILPNFPDIYQRRLRLYSIANQDYSELPQQQFGLVVSIDYLNYININEIKKCISDVYNLLRPGGTFIFSYNDCDTRTGAKLADTGVMSVCTGTQIREHCSNLGFELISLEHLPIRNPFYRQISCIEVRKPGELRTVKMTQALGEVKSK